MMDMMAFSLDRYVRPVCDIAEQRRADLNLTGWCCCGLQAEVMPVALDFLAHGNSNAPDDQLSKGAEDNSLANTARL